MNIFISVKTIPVRLIPALDVTGDFASCAARTLNEHFVVTMIICILYIKHLFTNSRNKEKVNPFMKMMDKWKNTRTLEKRFHINRIHSVTQTNVRSLCVCVCV